MTDSESNSKQKPGRDKPDPNSAMAVALAMLITVVVGVSLWMLYDLRVDQPEEPDEIEAPTSVETITDIDPTSMRPERAEPIVVDPVDKEPAPEESERLDDDRFDDFRDAYQQHFDDERHRLIHMMVDRPMYRPGQKIRWHLWRLSAQLGRLSGADELDVELLDPEGSVVDDASANAEFRGAAGQFELDEEDPGGQWTLRVVDGDDDDETLFERPILVSEFEPPRFHQQVDFDREAYRQGDDVQVDIEIRRDTGDPLAGQPVEGYLQIGGSHVEDIETELDAAGQADVEFSLPSSIDDAHASLVISIEEGGMVETDVWPVPLALDELSVEFFPEGGDLVEGLQSRVYFEATDLSGEPVDIEGQIVDEQGRFVEHVAAEHEGRGRFALSPEPGEEYVLQVNDDDVEAEFELPEPEDEGCVLRHYDDFDSVADSVRVGVWCTEEQTVGVVGAMADELFDIARMEAGPDEPAVAHLTPEDGEWPRPAGTVRTTVVEDRADIDVLADRVGFYGRRAQLDIDIELDQQVYEPGDTAEVEISVEGLDGAPVVTDLVLAAVDDRVHTEADHLDVPSILSSLLLETDDIHFWGDLDEAKQYFDLYEDTAEGLDLLVGTRGWRSGDERDGYFVDGGNVQIPEPPPVIGRPARPERRPQPRPQPPEEPIGLWDEEVADEAPAIDLLANDGVGGGAGAADGHAGRAAPEPQPQPEAQQMQRAPAPQPQFEEPLAAEQPEPQQDEWTAPGATSPRFMRDDDAVGYAAWEPELTAGSDGTLRYELELPEAVGAYRVVVEGVSESNMVGTADKLVPVEAPLSATVRMPEILSGGDRVDLPITLRNANDADLEATVQVNVDGAAAIEDSLGEFEALVPGWSSATHYVPMRVDDTTGDVTVEVWAQGSGFSDGASREASIKPRGFERTWTASGELPGSETHEVPLMGMTDAGVEAELAIYPSPVAEALEGVESMAQRPMGCFEQTSSRNHPNLLVWRYLKAEGGLDSDMESTLRDHIAHGYQQLSGFEADGGGFEWFGRGDGQAYLTAWGLVQFEMMEPILDDFDDRIIERSVGFLRQLADDDGGWNDGNRAWQRISGQRREAAELFVVYSLARAGYAGAFEPQMQRAERVATGGDDPYLVALAAAAMVAADRDSASEAVEHLAGLQDSDGGFRPAPGSQSWAGGYGGALNVETTGLAAWAMIEGGGAMPAASEAIGWLDERKTARSWWGSTQATAMALEARVAYERGDSGESEGPVVVSVDGEEVATKQISTDDQTPKIIEDLGDLLSEENRDVEIRSEVPLTYDLEATWRLEDFDVEEEEGPLDFEISHDDLEEVSMGDEITLEASLKNRDDRDIGMSVIRLALPAGVEVREREIDALLDRSSVDYYETTGREIVLYFDEFEAEQHEELRLSATADVPGVYEAPASVAYAYYRDESEWQWSQPGRLQVAVPH